MEFDANMMEEENNNNMPLMIKTKSILEEIADDKAENLAK